MYLNFASTNKVNINFFVLSYKKIIKKQKHFISRMFRIVYKEEQSLTPRLAWWPGKLVCWTMIMPTLEIHLLEESVTATHTFKLHHLYCDFHKRMWRYSSSSFLSFQNTILQTCCSQSRYSADHLVRDARWLELNGMKSIDQRILRPLWWNLIRNVWLETFRPIVKNNCLCCWVAVSLLLRRTLNSAYWLSVAKVVHLQPWTARSLTFTGP